MSTQNATCIIPSNPEISGVGVRSAIYIQSFTAFIASFLPIFSGFEMTGNHTINWESGRPVVMANLLLGFALNIAAFAQAQSPGLTVYHAILILNLHWIIAMGGAPYILSMLRSIGTATKTGRNWSTWSKALCMPVTYSIYLCLTSAFALWLFTTIDHFDTSGSDCLPTIVYYVFGHLRRVHDRSFRNFWIVVYSVLAVPIVNVLFIFIIFLMSLIVAGIALLTIIITIILIVVSLFAAFRFLRRRFGITVHGDTSTTLSNAMRTRSFLRIYMTFSGVVVVPIYAFPVALMILLTERTIASNTVDKGESAWTFGQTVALLVAVEPTFETVNAAIRTLWHIDWLKALQPKTGASKADASKKVESSDGSDLEQKLLAAEKRAADSTVVEVARDK